jgi:hypothetical protein
MPDAHAHDPEADIYCKLCYDRYGDAYAYLKSPVCDPNACACQCHVNHCVHCQPTTYLYTDANLPKP